MRPRVTPGVLLSAASREGQLTGCARDSYWRTAGHFGTVHDRRALPGCSRHLGPRPRSDQREVFCRPTPPERCVPLTTPLYADKDRLRGRQEYETRKRICQAREANVLHAEVHAEAGNVARRIRLGRDLTFTGGPANPNGASDRRIDLDALIASLAPDERALLAACLAVESERSTTLTQKTAEDRWVLGVQNVPSLSTVQRAGDRTRTGDVQLGKLRGYCAN